MDACKPTCGQSDTEKVASATDRRSIATTPWYARRVAEPVQGEFPRSFYVANAIELSSELARSATVMQCAARRWVQFALGRLPVSRESGLVSQIADRFVAGHGDFRELFTDIVTSPLFRQRKVTPR